jgi:hypothetical protein
MLIKRRGELSVEELVEAEGFWTKKAQTERMISSEVL